MNKRKDHYFVKKVYNGSDGSDFQKDFVEYLKEIIKDNSWSAMSEHQLFLNGAKTVLNELIVELEETPDLDC